ncbi:MAG: radical SAM protein [Candidatus Omnitrophica bacterium]|nr:radical SAM protein [Candidatus Omnitrophota bacterium]
MQYIKQIFKLINKKSVNPEYVTFFITNKCNAKCKHCLYWSSLNSDENELSCEEVKKISQNMGNFIFLLITGGEPFMREDISEIARIFYENNNIKKLSLVTNGYFTDKIIGHTKEILRRCPKLQLNLSISLDGIGKRHDEIRGLEGIFQRAINTIGNLKKVQNSYPKLSISTVCSFSVLNQNDIFDIYHYARDVLKLDSFNCPLVRGNLKDNSIKSSDIAIYKKLSEVVRADVVSGKLKGASDHFISNVISAAKFIATDLSVKTFEADKYITPCYAGKINVVIYPDGGVFPCELRKEKLGDLRTANYDFKKIWFSKKSKRVLEKIKETKCHCFHGCNMLPNVLYNSRYIPKMTVNYINVLLKRSGNNYN